MTIRTPADLIGYLKGVAARHERVKQVITGEHSRVEDSTGATARYPMVEIETPTVIIPRSQGQNSMSTRVYVTMNTPEDDNGTEDFNSDDAYRIASDIIAAIKYHAEDDIIAVSLSDRSFELNPIVATGSDQVRGWGFAVTVEIDQALCKDNALNPVKIFVPMFSWRNEQDINYIGGDFKITNESILGDGATDSMKFWKQEAAVFPEPTEFDPETENIFLDDLPDLDPPHRIVHVWCRIVGNGLTLWAYARIDARYKSGRSTPFLPEAKYPID